MLETGRVQLAACSPRERHWMLSSRRGLGDPYAVAFHCRKLRAELPFRDSATKESVWGETERW